MGELLSQDLNDEPACQPFKWLAARRDADGLTSSWRRAVTVKSTQGV